MNDKKHLYSISWTQPWPGDEYRREMYNALEELLDTVIDLDLERGNYTEAKVELERIMKL